MAQENPRDLYASPRVHLAEAVERYGENRTVDGCLEALTGSTEPAVPLTYLGGAAARHLLDQADLGQSRVDQGSQAYWVRTWGARGLLYVWAPYAGPALVPALSDEHWRVREMAAKVVAKREIGEAAEALFPLLDDEVPRAQVAALRAAGTVGESEHARAITALVFADRSAHAAAERALVSLRARLDRPDL